MTELWIVLGALAIIAISVFVTSKTRNECEDRGGVYVRSAYSHVCMKGEVIK